MGAHELTRVCHRVSELRIVGSGGQSIWGARHVEDIFASVERLKYFPESGGGVPELRRDNIREVFFQRYRIIYGVEPGSVEILTIRHMRQLLGEEEVEY